MIEREVTDLLDWSKDGLSTDIRLGRTSALEKYTGKLDKDPLMISLVRLICPSSRRVSKFRGRSICRWDTPDLEYDLKSYRGLKISGEELQTFLSAMVFLETAYYGLAENMASNQARLYRLNRSYFEDSFKERVSWLIWARWDTQKDDCFFSLHKAIVCELSRTEYSTREVHALNKLFYTSYEHLPEDVEYVALGQINTSDKKPLPAMRIRERLGKMHLADIVSHLQFLPYFEQYCFIVALGYGINDPNITAFKRTFGVGGNCVEEAIDRVIDAITEKAVKNPLNFDTSFYQVVEAAKNNAIVYAPNGIRMPHTYARCKLIGKPCPDVDNKSRLIFELAAARDKQRLVYNLEDISRLSGISRIVVERRIRKLANSVVQ